MRDRPNDPTPVAHDCQVVELRQYTLQPQRREVLIELFERELVETQEALGMRVLGQFRDLDDPDRFVWLRGFGDMASRALGLQAFYDGPVWAAHRAAANATMVDSDDVLLLRPAWPGSGLDCSLIARVAPGATRLPSGLLDLTVFPLAGPARTELLSLARDAMTTMLRAGGADVLGWYVTESSGNNFPRLPVREGEDVLVGLALFGDDAEQQAFAASGSWQRDITPALSPYLRGAAKSIRLAPTARSAIHARRPT